MVAAKRKRANLKWELAALEAKAGLAPRLVTVKKAQQAKAKKSTDSADTAPASTDHDQSEILEQIERLKSERFNRKMFQIRTKELGKAVKMARNREIQRSVKQLKSIRAILSKMEEKMASEFGVTSVDSFVDGEQVKSGGSGIPEALLKSYRKQRNRAESAEKRLQQLKMTAADMTKAAEQALMQRLKESKFLQQNSIFNSSSNPPPSTDSSDGSVEFPLKDSKPFQEFLDCTLVDLEVYLKAMDESIPRSALSADLDRRNQLLKRKREQNMQQMAGEKDEGEGEDDEEISSEYNGDDGYQSSSSSSSFGDPFDGDDGYEALEKGKKKNRPGQQARRQKWEQLYGQQANHLQQQQQQQQRNRQPAHRRSGQQPEQPVPESLHPSWEAKRRQRELMKGASSSTTTGTKILFGDDDD